MSDSKHTPGPWAVRGSIKSVDGDDLYVGYVFPDIEGYRGDVCSVQSADHISGITRDEAAANASLIAAAPDLLAACERALPALECVSGRPGDTKFEIARDASLRIQYAIAKAKEMGL